MARKTALSAVIDVGSNQLTMKIAELPTGNKPRVIEEVRGSLALGEDTYTSQNIRKESIRRCCEILQGFNHKLKEYKIEQVRVVATSAIREALNRDYVCTRIQQSCGLEVEILDNNIERFYHQLSMTECMPQFGELIQEGVTVLDIGAGSIQISSYDKNGLAYSHNLLLGALRVHEMMDRLRDRTRDYIALLDEYIGSELNDFQILEGDNKSPTHLIVLGAQLPYFKKLAGLKKDDELMPVHRFKKLLDELRRDSPIDLSTQYGIPANEAELLLPAASILEKYLTNVRADMIHMPPADLTDSLLLELSVKQKKAVNAYDHERDIVTSARHIAKRFRYDQKHTKIVTKHALALFDVLAKPFGLTKRLRIYLELAAILHDSGKFLQINRHSRQSFHIINSLDLFGISNRERLLIAYIARFHSAVWSPSLEDMIELDRGERQLVLQLAAILRLADGLDASHTQKLTNVIMRVRDNRLIVSIDNSIDTTLETSTTEEKGLLLLEVYGLVLEFKYLAPERFEAKKTGGIGKGDASEQRS